MDTYDRFRNAGDANLDAAYRYTGKSEMTWDALEEDMRNKLADIVDAMVVSMYHQGVSFGKTSLGKVTARLMDELLDEVELRETIEEMWPDEARIASANE